MWIGYNCKMASEMPLVIHPSIPKKEPNRSRAFNNYVRASAPDIAAVRAAGIYEVRKIAKALDERENALRVVDR